MNELLHAAGKTDHGPPALLGAAIHGLESLVSGPAAEHSALDLLAIDGLVTAAFAAAHDATELGALADEASDRLMALGGRPA
jgi:hypothetical protein